MRSNLIDFSALFRQLLFAIRSSTHSKRVPGFVARKAKAMKRKFLLLLCWFFSVFVVVTGHSAPGGPLHKREFQLIDPAEFSGGDFGDAWDVNNLGQVVGAANTIPQDKYSAFIFDIAHGLRF